MTGVFKKKKKKKLMKRGRHTKREGNTETFPILLPKSSGENLSLPQNYSLPILSPVPKERANQKTGPSAVSFCGYELDYVTYSSYV